MELDTLFFPVINFDSKTVSDDATTDTNEDDFTSIADLFLDSDTSEEKQIDDTIATQTNSDDKTKDNTDLVDNASNDQTTALLAMLFQNTMQPAASAPADTATAGGDITAVATNISATSTNPYTDNKNLPPIALTLVSNQTNTTAQGKLDSQADLDSANSDMNNAASSEKNISSNSTAETNRQNFDDKAATPTINVTQLDRGIQGQYLHMMNSADKSRDVEVKTIAGVFNDKGSMDEKVNTLMTQLSTLVNQQTQTLDPFANKLVMPTTSVDMQAIDNMNKATTEPKPSFNMEILPALTQSEGKPLYDAFIKIYPPELGHIIAKLKINNETNTAQLQLQTQNIQVKQIIEANLPALRDNFQQANLRLDSIQIQVQPDMASSSNLEQSKQEHSASQQDQPNQDPLKQDAKNSSTTFTPKNKQLIDSLVDTYA